MKPLINDNVIDKENYVSLWCQMIARASDDAQHGQLDAVLWLLTDARGIFEVLDMDYMKVYKQVRKWYIKCLLGEKETVSKTYIQFLGIKDNNSRNVHNARARLIPPMKMIIQKELEKLDNE